MHSPLLMRKILPKVTRGPKLIKSYPPNTPNDAEFSEIWIVNGVEKFNACSTDRSTGKFSSLPFLACLADPSILETNDVIA